MIINKKSLGEHLLKLHERLRVEGRLVLTIKACPGKSKNEIKEIFENGSLKVHIAALPVRGLANKELQEFLADVFSVPKYNVRIIKGHASRDKVVEVIV